MARLHKTSVRTTGLRTYVLSLHSPMVSLKKKIACVQTFPLPQKKISSPDFFLREGGRLVHRLEKKRVNH